MQHLSMMMNAKTKAASRAKKIERAKKAMLPDKKKVEKAMKAKFEGMLPAKERVKKALKAKLEAYNDKELVLWVLCDKCGK